MVVSDNGTNVATLYNGNTGAKVPLTVAVAGGPTGTLFNIAGAGFAVPGRASSRFLFASEDGQIRSWPGSGTVAQVTAAQSLAPAAKYKGLAIAVTPDGPRLYATDFHNNHVDVWDSSWNLVTSATFTDPSLPTSTRRSGSRGSATRSSSPTHGKTPRPLFGSIDPN